MNEIEVITEYYTLKKNLKNSSHVAHEREPNDIAIYKQVIVIMKLTEYIQMITSFNNASEHIFNHKCNYYDGTLLMDIITANTLTPIKIDTVSYECKQYYNLPLAREIIEMHYSCGH